MLTGMSPSDAHLNAAIARSRPQQCSITVGVHPDGRAYFASMAKTIAALQAESATLVSAFGELGLDYDHLAWAGEDVQMRTFRAQLELLVGAAYDVPLFLHCRAAFEDFVGVLEAYVARLLRRGLVHSFVGSAAQMGRLVEMGFDVSVSGFAFREGVGEMVGEVPLGRLQLETDAPWGRYLVDAPVLAAGKKRDRFVVGAMVKERNESCAMSQVAFVVAGVKGLSVEEVARAAWENSTAMFRLGA
ncbi:Metallo-dependent hydrolase [Karstenula rhodostoma CBS 690.94]|uniref:Metallo-dependent hydrolase n=1 Tax=Karstenula rhodostoma CBS 690.94 TaxID=1392251 RepID=A0A9P4PK31_9PLEO|nr:Metallo-dependent hydrolase [Karstenula rhodostoma CBS 690.94]